MIGGPNRRYQCYLNWSLFTTRKPFGFIGLKESRGFFLWVGRLEFYLRVNL